MRWRKRHFPPPAVPVALAASLLAIGFLVGRWTAPTRGQVSPEQTPSRPSAHDNAMDRPEDWNARVTKLLAQPPSAGRSEQLALAVERLAGVDPESLLAAMQRESDLGLRDVLVGAALHGWARRAPQAAAQWMRANLSPDRRRAATTDLVRGALESGQFPRALLEHFCANDPALTADFGQTFVSELARIGEFDVAAELARQAPAEHREAWVRAAFFAWAQHQPEAAFAAAGEGTSTDPGDAAWQGLAAGWIETRPGEFAEHALRLPASEWRSRALSDALRRWVAQEPVRAAAWLDRQEPSAELDPGVAAVATMPELKPEVAVSWATSITDAEVRRATLVTIIRTWLARDPRAAYMYVRTTPELSPDDRAHLSAVLDGSE